MWVELGIVTRIGIIGIRVLCSPVRTCCDGCRGHCSGLRADFDAGCTTCAAGAYCTDLCKRTHDITVGIYFTVLL
jgi:hypothetical protein